MWAFSHPLEKRRKVLLNVSEKFSSHSFLLNDIAQNTTDCNFIHRGRQLRRVIIQLHYALFLFSHLIFHFAHLPSFIQRFSLRRCSCMHSSWSYSDDVPGEFFSTHFLFFFILSCTLCSLSLFFCSAAVVFGWSWTVSTKPMDLCGVCSVNPVNFSWHSYKWPAQELTRDCVLLRCLTRTYVHQSTSGHSLLIHCKTQSRVLRNGLHIFPFIEIFKRYDFSMALNTGSDLGRRLFHKLGPTQERALYPYAYILRRCWFSDLKDCYWTTFCALKMYA